jgi:predicted RNase H-like HicB family nuclease
MDVDCCAIRRASKILRKNGDVSNFAVVIHEEPEGGYWAEVPALPGCYSQGETVPELLENVREAISGVLDLMAELVRSPESNIQILDVAV